MRRFLWLALVVVAFSLLNFRWRQWSSEIRCVANALIALAFTYTGTAVVLRGVEWVLTALGNPALGHSIGHASWLQGVAAFLGLTVSLYIRIRCSSRRR